MKNKPYLVLARKYRPQNFLWLYGQEMLVKILNISIKTSRLAQAYLLTGIRGVGKTTSARIISKTINCTSPKEQDDIIIPCEECSNCQSILQNKHPDIIEMDAASHTGVDDIRDIIEGAQYKPLLGKYKVFIIDEVHMLSKNAFNALLKLLEEPPLHVIFIFATTEVNKIPITIISRCQRFDLKRLTDEELLTLLEKICKTENFLYEIEALKIIALKADGSARDALSLLDQAFSLATSSNSLETTETYKGLTIEVVSEMVGATNLENSINFVEAVLQKNVRQAIECINVAYNTGEDLINFTENILDYIAVITKTKTIEGYDSKIYSSYKAQTQKLANALSLAQLTIIWQIFLNSLYELKNSYHILHSLEMTTIKAIYSSTLPSPKEIISQIIYGNLEDIKPLETSFPRQL